MIFQSIALEPLGRHAIIIDTFHSPRAHFTDWVAEHRQSAIALPIGQDRSRDAKAGFGKAAGAWRSLGREHTNEREHTKQAQERRQHALHVPFPSPKLMWHE